MRTEQIQYFLETVKTGSFTKAAENLGVQQPSLREGITRLEEELGTPLFNRGKRGVELNDYGRYCLPYMQFMADSYVKMKQNYCSPSWQEKSSVQIDFQKTYDMYLPSFYQMAKTKMPQTLFQINTEDTIDAIINRVLLGKTDIGFITASQEHKSNNQLFHILQSQSLSSSIIKSFEVEVLMRKDHPLRNKKSIMLKDFYNYQMIVTNTNSFLENKMALSKVNKLKINNWKMVEAYLESTDGVALTAKDSNKNIELITRTVSPPLKLTQIALYKEDCLNEMTIQIVNTVKLAMDMIFMM